VGVPITSMTEQSCGPIRLTAGLFGVPPSMVRSVMDGGSATALPVKRAKAAPSAGASDVVSNRIHLRFFWAFDLASGRTSFVSLPGSCNPTFAARGGDVVHLVCSVCLICLV